MAWSSAGGAWLFFVLLLATGLLSGSLGEDKNETAVEGEPETEVVCDFVEKMDHYERLGVDRDADDRTLKKAYRKLSLQYHPDKNKGKGKECAQKHFIAISKAYELLSDPERRKKYDAFGDIEEGDGGFGEGGTDPFSMFQQFFERSGGFPGGFGGGGQQFFFTYGNDEGFMMPQEAEIDISECVDECILEYRKAGYGGDLEGHCVAECEQQAQQMHSFAGVMGGGFSGGGFEFEFPMGGPYGGGGGGGGGGFFQGGGANFEYDPYDQEYFAHMHQGGGDPYYVQQQEHYGGNSRSNILEHMMRGGGDPRAGGGGRGMGRGETEHVLVEDQFGNQYWQEVEVDNDDYYEYFGGGGGDPYQRQRGHHRGHMPRTGGNGRQRAKHGQRGR